MSEVKSKVPGVVDEVKAAVGDKIEKGQPIVILEAMKMKMPVASPEAGVLKWRERRRSRKPRHGLIRNCR